VEGEAVEETAPGQVEEGGAHEGRLHDVEVDLDAALLQVEEHAGVNTEAPAATS